MGLKERRKKIMALMLAACVAGTSTVPVTASDISVFSDGTDTVPEIIDSSDAVAATDTNVQKYVKVTYVDAESGDVVDDTYTVKVPSDAAKVSVIDGKFHAPKGYKLVTFGEFLI